MTDVVFVVEGEGLPAHSHFLAMKSGVLRMLLEDCPAFSKQQPLEISKGLEAHKAADLQTFLQHIYKSANISSATEARQLFTVADYFGCSELICRARQFLEDPEHDFVKTTCGEDGVLSWLEFAQRFKLTNLSQLCLSLVCDHFAELQSDSQMQQLSASTFIQLMDRQQEMLRSSTIAITFRSGFVHYRCGEACPGHKIHVSKEGYGYWTLDIRRTSVLWCGARAAMTSKLLQMYMPSDCEELVAKLQERMPQCMWVHT